MNRLSGSRELPGWIGIAALVAVVIVLGVVGYRMMSPPRPADKVTVLSPQGAQGYAAHYGARPESQGSGATAGNP